MTNLQKDAMAYSAAYQFLNELRLYRDRLSPQEFRTLKGQALSGDVQGATKGLAELLQRLRS